MEVETGIVAGAGHAPLLGITTEGLLEVLELMEFLGRCRDLNLKEVVLNIPRLT